MEVVEHMTSSHRHSPIHGHIHSIGVGKDEPWQDENNNEKVIQHGIRYKDFVVPRAATVRNYVKYRTFRKIKFLSTPILSLIYIIL